MKKKEKNGSTNKENRCSTVTNVTKISLLILSQQDSCPKWELVAWDCSWWWLFVGLVWEEIAKSCWQSLLNSLEKIAQSWEFDVCT